MAAEKPFAIVHFTETEEIELVPTKWLRQTCYWPNYKKDEKITAAVKGLSSPCKSEWSVHEIRLLHTFNSYDEAKPNVSHFEEFSELSECDSPKDLPQLKSRTGRILKKNQIKFGISSNFEAIANVSKHFHLGLVNPPKFPDSLEDSHLSEDESSSIVVNSNTACSSPEPINNGHAMSSIFEEKFKEFQKDVFMKMATIEANQNTMLNAIRSLLNNTRVNNFAVSQRQEQQPDFGFPFASKESLLNFDSKLKNDHPFRQSAIRYLKSLGGSDLPSTVAEILKKLMTFKVAYHFNYTGMHGKADFSSLNTNELVFDIVKLNPRTSTETMVSVRNRIKVWVQHAGDKLTSEERRAILSEIAASVGGD
ncbi:unnamed protein product [Allacma fusca]|uniref:DUF4806 domain-containing protein n=1 Tax=Allacma fusca TaxID=39272 RepID=A0A8J2JX60_9HEXA|nr:unnamed protein product [Allacma fusca]